MATLIFGWFLRLAFIVTIALYCGMVLTNYAVRGSAYRVRFDFGDPAWSIKQLLVWCGVRLLAGIVRMMKAVLDLLIEASADVGEWFISTRSERVQAEFRSRFL
ncbi:MAG TPA: hypothetical protein VMI06_02475 [Terriglobia bacterium]|nr:hypothetical protein [Terriglobia bacterium]